MIYLGLIWEKGVRSVSKLLLLLFLVCAYQVVQATFIEETIFMSLYYSCPFNSDQLSTFTWVCLSDLYSIYLFFLPIDTVLIIIALNNS